MARSSVAIEVDGDQVTFVELSGDLAVSSVTVNASTLRDSAETVLRGFRQRRSDPPVPVALVAPGLRFVRTDVTGEEVSDPSPVRDRIDPSGADAVSLALPDSPSDGSVAPAFGMVVPAELVQAVSEALGSIRHEVFAAAACVPVDGVFVGLHMSSATLTVVASGRPLLIRELASGGLARVAAAVSPGDTQAGLLMVSEALGGGGSVVVEAELARHLRVVFREVSRDLRSLEESGRIPSGVASVCCFGVGAQDVLAGEAAGEAGLRLEVPQQVSDALLYLPISRRLPALSALGAAVAPPQPLRLPSARDDASLPSSALPGRVRRIVHGVALAASSAALVLSAALLHSQIDRASVASSELAALPPTVTQDADLRAVASRDGTPDWMLQVASVYASQLGTMSVTGVSFGVSGPSVVTLSVDSSDGLSGLAYAMSALRRVPGVTSAEVLSVSGDGSSTTVEVLLEVSR